MPGPDVLTIHQFADTTVREMLWKCSLCRSLCLQTVLFWTQLYVCCCWSELSFKGQRGAKLHTKKFEDPNLSGNAYSRSTLSVPADRQAISLLQSDLSQSKQSRKRKDDILGSDDESDDAASASGDSSDSYGNNMHPNLT